MANKPITFEFEFRGQRYKDAQKGLEAFAKVLSTSPERAAPALKKEISNYLQSVARALASRHGNAWPGGTTPASMSSRSGNAMRSIQDSLNVTGDSISNIQGEIGGAFYLRTHEYGATIRARNSKYLTIPLEAALNSDGTPKKLSAREWDNTFVARSRNGNLLIFQKQGHTIVPLYVLKTEVTIPPRLGMGKTLQAGMSYFVDKAMDAMLKAVRSG